ncbi:MAG: hypothetical protein M1832_002395 [Thelocarpon impressellum]|nr:MAG: hypothetical protein M1832_002395 [Thelocarpon impressellum]
MSAPAPTFLTLPRELRDSVYSLVLLSNARDLSILRVCRQSYAEARLLPFTLDRGLTVADLAAGLRLLRKLSPGQVAALAGIRSTGEESTTKRFAGLQLQMYAACQRAGLTRCVVRLDFQCWDAAARFASALYEADSPAVLWPNLLGEDKAMELSWPLPLLNEADPLPVVLGVAQRATCRWGCYWCRHRRTMDIIGWATVDFFFSRSA